MSRMKFDNVCIESLAVALPDEIWTSAEIEERLRPLYERLKLPVNSGQPSSPDSNVLLGVEMTTPNTSYWRGGRHR